MIVSYFGEMYGLKPQIKEVRAHIIEGLEKIASSLAWNGLQVLLLASLALHPYQAEAQSQNMYKCSLRGKYGSIVVVEVSGNGKSQRFDVEDLTDEEILSMINRRECPKKVIEDLNKKPKK